MYFLDIFKAILPVIFAGVVVVLLVKKVSKIEKLKKSETYLLKGIDYAEEGMAIGCVLGIIIGLFFQKAAMGMALGIFLGLIVGSNLKRK